MKHILILLSLFLSLPIFSQNIGRLSYQQLIQSYRGDTVYAKLNGDSVNYYTDLGSFRFNKDIYVKGVKLGSAVGSASSVIATQLKNYNANQDTVIRLPNLASGKFGIWQDINNGISNSLYTNNHDAIFNKIQNNSGVGFFIVTNTYQGENYGIGFAVNTNSGKGFEVNENSASTGIGFDCYNVRTGIAFKARNIYSSTGIGLYSYANDTVSNTSGALTGIFGKTESHLDIDGFGHYRNIQTTPPTITLGSGAGTGATYTLIAGSTDKAGVISVTTGTSPTASGDIFTITYRYPFKGIAVFIAVPANNAASSVQGQARPHMNGYSPTFSGLTASGSALTAGTTYVWHYFVAQ